MRDVGQSSALRDLFREVYAARRPRRVAVLGCTTGSDLALVDPATTELAVGVDVNAAYLAVAAERLASFGAVIRLVHGDVLDVALPDAPFDLVHAALLLEYVEPRRLFARVRQWLAPNGVCAVVMQDPSADVPAVSASSYASLQELADSILLRRPEELVGFAEEAGLRSIERRAVALPSGKRLTGLVFGWRPSP